MLAGVLQQPVTDVDASLFDLGATSMALVQLHELVNGRYPGRLTFQDYFDFPTVRGLARRLEGAAAIARSADATEVIEL
jgi:hypothetical protein